MDLQEFQNNYTTRIKFAIAREDSLTEYEHTENHYGTLWEKLPKGWISIEEGKVLVPRHRQTHRARLLNTPSGDMVAVEHETGPEIVAAGAAVVSAAAAVVTLFQTWRNNRRIQQKGKAGSRRTKIPKSVIGRDALLIETRNEAPNGIVSTTTTTIPAHLVTTEILLRLIDVDRAE